MEKYILEAPISKSRTDQFLLDYLKDREQCGALEAIFEQAQSYRQEGQWQDRLAVGFNVLLRKGPFVEDSNWFPYRPWQFALALERNLLSRFESLIRQREARRIDEFGVHGWSDILPLADELNDMAGGPRGSDRALVITGGLHENWLLDLTQQQGMTADWDLPGGLNRTWILGAYRDSLILHIQESPTQAVHIVNIPRFGEMIQYGSAMLEITEIDENRAVEMAKAKGQTTDESKIRDLRLHVGLRLYESWEITTRPEAGSAIAGCDFATLT